MKASQSTLEDTDISDVASSKQKSNEDDSAFAETAASVLKNLYEDPILSDLEIEGTDGMRISVHRPILVSRSPVFKQLLAGEFSEAKSPVVSLGFEGAVMKAVVAYCYTDEFSFICDKTGEDCEESIVRFAMDLAAAADYFALPKLSEKVVDWATAKMEHNPALVWVFLVAAESAIRPDVWTACCRKIISFHSGGCLSVGDDLLAGVSMWALEQIVSDDASPANETTLFTLIASWWKATTIFHSKKRKTDAVDLVARNIHLDRMKASDLAAIVEPSGLVTSTQLYDAYRAVATRAEVAGFPASSMFRGGRGGGGRGGGGGRWETTKSNIVHSAATNHGTELLECQPMRTGKHQWSIEVTSFCDPAFLGLASSSGEINRTLGLWHSTQQHGWAWRNDGWTYHNAGSKHQGRLSGFKQGDTVTFTLDLSGPVISLKACVNNCSEEHTIFGHDELTTGEGADYSFVPAVSLKAPGAVRFCGFTPV